MLKRIFQRGKAGTPLEPHIGGRPPTLPQGVRVYVVGDIHGRFDLLRTLTGMIAADLAANGKSVQPFLVHLGDYVDRGFDSRKVIDELLAQSHDEAFTRVHLLGNHDFWLRAFAKGLDQDGSMASSWLRFGGDATLLSYGVKLDLKKPERERFAEAAASLAQRLPASHMEFLDRLELGFGLGDYFFCHAGIRPDVPLEQQTEADLLWIREPFLSWSGACGKIIVHGHTVEELPVVRSNRIGIDTGACWTGKLTCLVLEGTQRRFMRTGR